MPSGNGCEACGSCCWSPAVVICLDQATKEGAHQYPQILHIVPIPQLGQAFVFEHVDNFGAALGIPRCIAAFSSASP